MHYLLQFLTAIMMMALSTGCKPAVPENPEENTEQNKPDTPETPDVPQPPEGPQEIVTDLTLVTYNVANMGHGGDRLEDIASFISKVGADFAGLNEVDSCNNRHSNYQLRDVAERLGGWSYHFASAFAFAGGGYGNGALCKDPLLDAFTVPIPRGSGHEPRSVAVLETDDIVFCATHLDFGPPGEPSYEQAVYLNQWFGEHYDCYSKPVILCGDFNTDPGTATIDEMDRCWTRLSAPNLSWPSDNPTMCLDYFFCYKGAADVELLDNSLPEGIIDYQQTSDHIPVVVKIRVTRKQGNPSGGGQYPAPVGAVALFGPAAGNSTSADPIHATAAVDASGNVMDNVFDIYLGPAGGKLRIKDDHGNFWRLMEDDSLEPGDCTSLPAADAAALLLRLDFGAGKWECIRIKSVLLQPYKSDAKPIPMVWTGKGVFSGAEWFIPEKGYTRYTYRVVSDRPDIVYAWVRGKGGALTPVPEGVNIGSVIFGAEAGLMQQKVSATVDIYNRTQSLKKDKRTYNAVLIGDSITRLWQQNESGFFSNNKYLGKGIDGQTSSTIRNRFNADVVDVKPYVVHIMCGTNDVAENDGRYVESSEVVANIAAMAQMARQTGIKVVVGSVFPCNFFSWRGAAWSPGKEGVTIVSHIQEINSLLKEYCQANEIPFIDYYSIFVNPDDGGFPLAYDRCHPGGEALKIMDETVKPVIDGLL